MEVPRCTASLLPIVAPETVEVVLTDPFGEQSALGARIKENPELARAVSEYARRSGLSGLDTAMMMAGGMLIYELLDKQAKVERSSE